MPSASIASAVSTAHWASLTDDQQLDLTRAALQVAIHTVAGQAEMLAGEMENGLLLDRGGPDALRLLAAALRVSSEEQIDAQPRRDQEYDLDRLTPMGCA